MIFFLQVVFFFLLCIMFWIFTHTDILALVHLFTLLISNITLTISVPQFIYLISTALQHCVLKSLSGAFKHF